MARFGTVRRLPSGRFQARYTGPDGKRYSARTEAGKPLTFSTEASAGKWLARADADIQRDRWQPPGASPAPARVTTLSTYAAGWLEGRDLSESTRLLYAKTLRHVLPALGATPLPELTPALVREWHAGLKTSTGPRMRAHAYSLLHAILNTAVDDEVIAANPCRVRGAGQAKRARQIEPASIAELEMIAASVPARYKVMILLGAWCAMRFGELTELRRSDIDVKNGVIHIRRGVIRTGGGLAVKGPKSDAGKRDVNIPPHLMPLVKGHLREHVAPRQDALVFPAASGGHMAPSALYAVFYPARDKAGRPDLRFHDLRHTGAVLAAATGATLAELMARLGHSTVSAALKYQHAAADRDKAIAEALSKLAADVIPISGDSVTRSRGRRTRTVQRR